MPDKRSRLRQQFKDVSTSLNLLATDTPTTVGAALIALAAKYTIYIQRISVHVRTSAAQALTFQDNNGTPKVVAILPASAAAGDIHVLIDSDEGIPLTEGKQLDMTGAAGVAATIEIAAYIKPTGTRTLAQL